MIRVKKNHFHHNSNLDAVTETRGIVNRLLKEYESIQSEPPRLILHSGDFAYAGMNLFLFLL